jgi:hypothetical protein
MPTQLTKMDQDQIKNDRYRDIALAAHAEPSLENEDNEWLSAQDLVYAVEMAVACAISYWIITSGLARFVDKPSDFLGGMWAVIATVFVFRDTRSNSVYAGLAKGCCEMARYFLGLAGIRRSLFKVASSRKRSCS